MLSSLVTGFLPRSKRLLISWLQSLSVVILEPKKIGTDSHCQGKPVSSALDVVVTLLETWFPNMASEKRRQIVQGSVPIPPRRAGSLDSIQWGRLCSPVENCYLRKGNPMAVFPGKQWFSTQPTNSVTPFYDQYCLMLLYMGLPRWFSGKESACQAGVTGDAGLIPELEDPLEKVMATHTSILARISPWTEEPGGLLSMGSQRDGHVLVTEPTSMLPYTPEMKLMNNTHILKNNQNIVLAVTSRRNKRKLTCKYCLE